MQEDLFAVRTPAGRRHVRRMKKTTRQAGGHADGESQWKKIRGGASTFFFFFFFVISSLGAHGLLRFRTNDVLLGTSGVGVCGEFPR